MSKIAYLCGIGGSGMSALARYYQGEGYIVLGSDGVESPTTLALQNEDITVFIGQKAENLSGITPDVFVITEAIDNTNPELELAKENGWEIKKYFEVLGEISSKYYTIAVSGTHGKSSTVAMIGTMLRDAGKEVISIVGASVHDWGGKNFLKANEGAADGNPLKKFFVVEACEYRENFMSIDPKGIVVTNIEHDHPDYFKTDDQYFKTFQKFLAKLPQFGFFSAFLEGENMMEILPPNFHPRKFGAEDFETKVPTLKVQGSFQRKNAASALAVAEALKIDQVIAGKSLENFQGLSRRFDIIGEKDDIIIIEDYAHHPTSVKLSIQSARDLVRMNSRKKLWVVFQPHQYSRTLTYFEDFCSSLHEADEILIPNIYASRDSQEDQDKLSGEYFVEEIEKVMTKVERKRSNVWGRGTKKRGEVFYKKQVRYTDGFDNTLAILREDAYKGDVVLIIGAGNVNEIATRFLNE